MEYNEEIATQILNKVSSSTMGLVRICKSIENCCNVRDFYEWIRTNEDFAKRYARAKEDQADMLIEEMLEIADDTHNDTMLIPDGGGGMKEVENKEWVNRSRLKVDVRKFIASKLKPKKYGDKIDITSDGEKVSVAPILVLDNQTKENLDKIK